MTTAHFSSESLDAASIPQKRTGVIFRPGAYGEKGTYTTADLDTIAANSAGQQFPVDVQHSRSPFDGKLGFFSNIRTSWDATGRPAVFGDWFEPHSLTALLGNAPRRVSIELDKATKKLLAVSLVVSPHIADAVVFSANDGMSPSRREELLSHTGLGRAVLGEAIDWAEVNRARVEAGLPPRTTAQMNKNTADDIIARRDAARFAPRRPF